MSYLIDTHTLIWAISDTNKLSRKVRKLIENLDNKIYISVVSLWEITVKKSLGKLEFGFTTEEFFDLITKTRIEVLNIEKDHLIKLQSLAYHHKDPFDRLIIAQCISENYSLISKDQVLSKYPLELIW